MHRSENSPAESTSSKSKKARVRPRYSAPSNVLFVLSGIRKI